MAEEAKAAEAKAAEAMVAEAKAAEEARARAAKAAEEAKAAHEAIAHEKAAAEAQAAQEKEAAEKAAAKERCRARLEAQALAKQKAEAEEAAVAAVDAKATHPSAVPIEHLLSTVTSLVFTDEKAAAESKAAADAVVRVAVAKGIQTAAEALDAAETNKESPPSPTTDEQPRAVAKAAGASAKAVQRQLSFPQGLKSSPTILPGVVLLGLGLVLLFAAVSIGSQAGAADPDVSVQREPAPTAAAKLPVMAAAAVNATATHAGRLWSGLGQGAAKLGIQLEGAGKDAAGVVVTLKDGAQDWLADGGVQRDAAKAFQGGAAAINASAAQAARRLAATGAEVHKMLDHARLAVTSVPQVAARSFKPTVAQMARLYNDLKLRTRPQPAQ